MLRIARSWRRASRGGALVLMLASVLLAGCAAWRTPVVPMRTIALPAPCSTPPDTLLVLLPGSHSLPEDFVREGFVQAAQAHGLAADLLLVDAHVAYYDERSVIERLRADVIGPARRQGYRSIWIVGISIGGVGAMLYSQDHRNDVDGIVILAPYLGSRISAQEIVNAGGLAAWQPRSLPDGDDFDLKLWRWLQTQTQTQTETQTQADTQSQPGSAGAPLPIFLAYGQDDRFVFNARVLGEALPPARVFATEGGHDWPVWQALWKELLPTLPLARDARCAAG